MRDLRRRLAAAEIPGHRGLRGEPQCVVSDPPLVTPKCGCCAVLRSVLPLPWSKAPQRGPSAVKGAAAWVHGCRRLPPALIRHLCCMHLLGLMGFPGPSVVRVINFCRYINHQLSKRVQKALFKEITAVFHVLMCWWNTENGVDQSLLEKRLKMLHDEGFSKEENQQERAAKPRGGCKAPLEATCQS